MFGSYLMTALRNLERNRLYAAITILGLAIAFAAAILIGQFVRDELSYDHWMAGYPRVYKIANTLAQPGQPSVSSDGNALPLASQISAVFPGAEAVVRLDEALPSVKARASDLPDTARTFAWADADIFKALPLPVLAGNLKAIAATWTRTNPGQPFNQLILSQFRLGLYLDLVIQGVTIGICAALAVLIACLGLFALSAYTTERRTKEIGVRKAMGADTRAVVLLLLWQFTVPVLAATALAVPLGFLAMSWWLHGFVYHAPLSAWTFVLAAAAGIGIAWLTVSWQSWAVARAKPAGALRYE